MHRRCLLALAIAVVMPLAACAGGGGTDLASPSPCPTVSPGASPTPTPDPGCVEAATQTESTKAAHGQYDFTLEQPIPQAGGTQIQNANLDINLTVEGDQVHGAIEGPTRQQLTQPSCPSNTVVDGRTTAEVEGTLTAEALELKVVSASWQRPEVEPCPFGGFPARLGETTASGIDGFDQSLSRLPRGEDGVYRLDRTETKGPAGYPYTVTYHIEVRFDDSGQ